MRREPEMSANTLSRFARGDTRLGRTDCQAIDAIRIKFISPMTYSFRLFLSVLAWLGMLFLEASLIMSYFPHDAETQRQVDDFIELSFIWIFPPLIELAVLLFVALALLIVSIIPARIVWNVMSRYFSDAVVNLKGRG